MSQYYHETRVIMRIQTYYFQQPLSSARPLLYCTFSIQIDISNRITFLEGSGTLCDPLIVRLIADVQAFCKHARVGNSSLGIGRIVIL